MLGIDRPNQVAAVRVKTVRTNPGVFVAPNFHCQGSGSTTPSSTTSPASSDVCGPSRSVELSFAIDTRLDDDPVAGLSRDELTSAGHDASSSATCTPTETEEESPDYLELRGCRGTRDALSSLPIDSLNSSITSTTRPTSTAPCSPTTTAQSDVMANLTIVFDEAFHQPFRPLRECFLGHFDLPPPEEHRRRMLVNVLYFSRNYATFCILAGCVACYWHPSFLCLVGLAVALRVASRRAGGPEDTAVSPVSPTSPRRSRTPACRGVKALRALQFLSCMALLYSLGLLEAFKAVALIFAPVILHAATAKSSPEAIAIFRAFVHCQPTLYMPSHGSPAFPLRAPPGSPSTLCTNRHSAPKRRVAILD